MTSGITPAGQASTALVTARFLRMLSIVLEQLGAVRDADTRAEFAGLTAHAKILERETDALEREIEDACLHAFTVARDLETFAPRVRSATLQDAMPIVRLLSQMVEHLSYAFAERDLNAAHAVMRLDFEQVDALYEQMQRASLTRLLERPEDTEVALTAGRMARHLERLGDHLVNVAERLETLVLCPERALH
ncbi:PhoU family transcriptional regulator [Deinococcus sp. KSM4-11]|uniref:phosphate signaling complex PhoU family protein n=1 Tax=Deinococcus sp. KSM4-11 TaxID=2568654 RepID=UPI0010A3209D|nr:PhoU domain-containing protein [Deinococcus sp. KSM4-11]THF88577.1 PhoU family transcriptional regulator [Deinococcus sp. KSM4-11]